MWKCKHQTDVILTFLWSLLCVSFSYIMPFSQLTLTVIITDPPGCPFLCLAELLAQTHCPGLHRGESASLCREYKRRIDEDRWGGLSRVPIRTVAEGGQEAVTVEKRKVEETGRGWWQGEERGGVHGRQVNMVWVDAEGWRRHAPCGCTKPVVQSYYLPSALCTCNVSIQELFWPPLGYCRGSTSRKI